MTFAAGEPAMPFPAIEHRHRDLRNYPHGVAFMDGQYLPMSEAKVRSWIGVSYIPTLHTIQYTCGTVGFLGLTCTSIAFSAEWKNSA